MLLTVGEIADVLGLTNENIRYYVREGLIEPSKNAENNYREYSSEDVLIISDILFYRYLGISINNIRKILNGMPLEEIGSVIEETEAEMLSRIKEYTTCLEELQSWKKQYREELASIGKYTMGYKPETIRIGYEYSDDEHIANYLRGKIQIDKEDWSTVSMSFFCDINKNPDVMYKYISLRSTAKTVKNNELHDLVAEPSKFSLITQVDMSENVGEMINPMLEFAAEHNIELTGEIYGHERTNYYIDGKRHWIYSLYAPILHPEKYGENNANIVKKK